MDPEAKDVKSDAVFDWPTTDATWPDALFLYPAASEANLVASFSCPRVVETEPEAVFL